MLCSVRYVRLVNVTQIEHTFGSACISVNRQIIQVAHCVLKDHSNWLMVWFIDFLYISIHATCLVWILLHCCIFPSLGMASITLFFIFFFSPALRFIHLHSYSLILLYFILFDELRDLVLFCLLLFVSRCCFAFFDVLECAICDKQGNDIILCVNLT